MRRLRSGAANHPYRKAGAASTDGQATRICMSRLRIWTPSTGRADVGVGFSQAPTVVIARRARFAEHAAKNAAVGLPQDRWIRGCGVNCRPPTGVPSWATRRMPGGFRYPKPPKGQQIPVASETTVRMPTVISRGPCATPSDLACCQRRGVTRPQPSTVALSDCALPRHFGRLIALLLHSALDARRESRTALRHRRARRRGID